MNPVTCLLLLLPDDPAAAAEWLRVDADGQILERGTADDARPLPPSSPTARLPSPARPLPPADTSKPQQVLVVPGVDVFTTWLELPAQNPVQALAAAQVLLEDRLATARDGLHIAVAAPTPGSHERLVVAVEADRMQAWLDRASDLGMAPDIVVPAPLLLTVPSRPVAVGAAPPETANADALESGRVRVVAHDGLWLVRGDRVAFAAEPVLARRIIDAPAIEMLPDVRSALAAGANHAPINLLQYRFAPPSMTPEGWPAWRRVAALALAVLVSLPALPAAQALRYELAARDLEARSLTAAHTVLPSLAHGSDPVPAIRTLMTRQQAGDRFARSTAALLGAVEAVAGTRLETLAWTDGELQTTIEHGSAGELEQLRIELHQAGFELVTGGTRDRDGRVHTQAVVRAQA